MSKNFNSSDKKDREIEHISKNFEHLFSRIGKLENQTKVTRFHLSLKVIQLKCRRVPIHLLDSEIQSKPNKGHNRNWKIVKKIESLAQLSLLVGKTNQTN